MLRMEHHEELIIKMSGYINQYIYTHIFNKGRLSNYHRHWLYNYIVYTSYHYTKELFFCPLLGSRTDKAFMEKTSRHIGPRVKEGAHRHKLESDNHVTLQLNCRQSIPEQITYLVLQKRKRRDDVVLIRRCWNNNV